MGTTGSCLGFKETPLAAAWRPGWRGGPTTRLGRRPCERWMWPDQASGLRGGAQIWKQDQQTPWEGPGLLRTSPGPLSQAPPTLRHCQGQTTSPTALASSPLPRTAQPSSALSRPHAEGRRVLRTPEPGPKTSVLGFPPQLVDSGQQIWADRAARPLSWRRRRLGQREGHLGWGTCLMDLGGSRSMSWVLGL